MAKAIKGITPEIMCGYRKALGMSQRLFGIDLATMVGHKPPFTRGYISNLETGKQPITEDLQKAIEEMYAMAKFERGYFIKNPIQHRPGQVGANSLFGGSSKFCKWGDCDNDFIPTSPNQKQCPSCQQRKRKS